MKKEFIEEVYDSLQGVLVDPLPGVQDLFEAGMPCALRYQQMLEAYGRLCDRLGVVDEDQDVEIIINALLANQRESSMKMYEYGMRFGYAE